jgi:CheY-like chemotaxis protein
MISETGRPIEILIVEDNAADVRLTIEALRDGKIHNRLYHAQDGIEALSILRPDRRDQAFRPDLILLDLNLPKMDGREVLSIIKKDDQLATIPVVVLTTSRAEEDILKSYGLHANCYIVKPIDFENFMDVVRGIERFWFSIVKLPPKPALA